MILLINTPTNVICMMFDRNLESNYLAMAELNIEIGAIVQKSIDEGNDDLSPVDVEYIIKITSDVTKKINFQILELTI